MSEQRSWTAAPRNRGPEVPEQEIATLNFYRASELHGGLVLGTLAGRVRDGELMARLTRHAAEEVIHAQLWTDTILAVGGRPTPIRWTYQRFYARELGPLWSVADVLALTQVFERRVYRHFLRHARQPDVHPVVRQTLERMIEEEKDHLSWVWTWLQTRPARHRRRIRDRMAAFAQADARIYEELEPRFGFGTRVA